MRAVSNSGPLIHLSWIDRLDLLAALFDEVLIPPSVRDEVLAANPGTLGLDHLLSALEAGSVAVVEVAVSAVVESLSEMIDPGEAEAIVLAEQANASVFLTHDADARLIAGRRGIKVAGTVGVLLRAREKGVIDSAVPLVLELRRLGQWLSDDIIAYVERHHVRRATERAE